MNDESWSPKVPRAPATMARGMLRVLRAASRLLADEAAGGIVLACATAVALVWTNAFDDASYRALVDARLVAGIGDALGTSSVHVVVNDVLMTVFFFAVGVEIKRELVAGHLKPLRRALLPLVAAVGGMAVPAGIFFAFNRSGPGQAGWAIPMATDIAFASGVLTLLTRRVPASAPIFLLALAIFDDIAGVIVIAAFYGGGLHVPALLAAALVLVVGAAALRRFTHPLVVAAVGVALWIAFHEGGVHPTLAGVALGTLIPADQLERQNLAARLRPWIAFGIVPLFAFVNAGVRFVDLPRDSFVAPVTLGVFAGLVGGKLVGVFAATMLGVRARLSTMPHGLDTSTLVGVSALAGIGFTVAMFIANLAFEDSPLLLTQAKVGILAGSGVAALVGGSVLLCASRARREGATAHQS